MIQSIIFKKKYYSKIFIFSETNGVLEKIRWGRIDQRNYAYWLYHKGLILATECSI